MMASVSIVSVRTRSLWGLLVSFILVAAISYYWSDRNPDWGGYLRIYDDGGAWLSASGRDSGFLWFVNSFRKQPFIPASYESFRVTLAVFFVYFSSRFMSGKVLAFPASHSVYLLAPLLSLVLIRGVVQIREGLAIVLFLFALKWFLLPRSRHILKNAVRILLVVALFFFSAKTHTVGLVAVFIFLSSLATWSLSNRASTVIAFVFTPLLTACFFLLSAQLGLLDWSILFAWELSGDRFATTDGVSFAEGMVWAIFIVLNIVMWFTTFYAPPAQSKRQAVLHNFARNLAGPVAVSGGIVVILMKAALVSPVVIVLIVRTAEFSSALAAVLVTVLYGKRFSPIILAGFLLLKTYNQLNIAGF